MIIYDTKMCVMYKKLYPLTIQRVRFISITQLSSKPAELVL